MIIGIYNCNGCLSDELLKDHSIITLDKITEYPEIDGLFIDWSSKNRKDLFLRQANIIQKYIKKIPIVIFDRNFSISKKEYKWFKRFKVHLFEPALKYRDGFLYMPHWSEMISIDHFDIEEGKRDIKLGYIGNIKDRYRSFENYYLTIASKWPKIKVYYNSEIDEYKIDEYNNANLKNKKFSYSDVELSIIIGNNNDYINGHLDSYIFEMMKSGCLPLLPYEHKYFSGMFRHTILNNVNDITWYNGWDDIRFASIAHIYNTIKRTDN